MTPQTQETERGWILKVNCKEKYLMVREDGEAPAVNITEDRKQATMFTNYIDAIKTSKAMPGADFRLVVAEKIKRDKLQ